MPKIRNIPITDSMLIIEALYDEGYSISEISKRLHQSENRVQLAIVRVGKSVDEAKYRPNTNTGRKFIKEWNKAVNEITGGK